MILLVSYQLKYLKDATMDANTDDEANKLRAEYASLNNFAEFVQMLGAAQ